MSKPVRIAVLCSGSASSFRYLQANDPNYGKTYVIVGVLSDVSEVQGIAHAEELGIPTRCIEYRAWCRTRGVRWTDLAAREEYFKEVLEQLRQWDVEAVMLSGFMLLITEPLLSGYPGRMLNVHPALLSLCTDEGKRKYTGLNVVARAMEAGDPTGSTVHLLLPEADMGPIIAESISLPYQPGDDPGEHQDRMKTVCDGPAFQVALERLLQTGWPRT